MRLVYFCDGTWNDPASNTNINKLYNATKIIPGVQLAHYDPGVGTDGNPIDHLLGGALGAGLVGKVKEGYTRLASLYTSGDEIFIFGFSRGSYTARCIAGMVSICGLPTANPDDECVDTAWQAYRNPDQRTELLATLGAYVMEDAKIEMLGVFDTVGALGIPALWGGIDDNLYGFLDTTLHPDVLNAYQALAIDEHRKPFLPTLWTSAPVVGQTLEQVWFTGVHCDVGGGYAPDSNDDSTNLSDITLAWMLSKAQSLGVVFAQDFATLHTLPVATREAIDVAHDSYSFFYHLTGGPVERTIADGSSIANSVAIRCQYEESGYAPRNLKLDANGLPNATTYAMVPVVVALPVPNPATIDWP